MKPTESVEGASNESGISTEGVEREHLPSARFAVCVDNSGYQASLERHKIYRLLPDPDAEADGDLRVIDESGEDYLYSSDRFVLVELPEAIERSLLRTS